MDDQPEEQWITIFTIMGPTFQAADLAQRITLSPYDQQEVGDINQFGEPNVASMLAYKLEESLRSLSIKQQLAVWIERLSAHKDLLIGLGDEADIFLECGVITRQGASISLDKQTIRALSLLNVDLEIYCYAGEYNDTYRI